RILSVPDDPEQAGGLGQQAAPACHRRPGGEDGVAVALGLVVGWAVLVRRAYGAGLCQRPDRSCSISRSRSSAGAPGSGGGGGSPGLGSSPPGDERSANHSPAATPTMSTRPTPLIANRTELRTWSCDGVA